MLEKEKNGIVYYEFENLANTDLVNHCFSSRIGGISKEPYTSMNLAYHMGDKVETVDENFKLISKVIGFDHEKIAMTNQIHQDEVHIINDYEPIPKGIDGLITTISGPVLTTYYADCVPLLFLDPIKKVIANSHAGWRGTMQNIAKKTVDKMVAQFACRTQDILVGIGPSISVENFEVGKEIAEEFERNFPQITSHLYQKSKQKWHIDLVAINRQLLIEAGLLDKNLEIANLCTYENSQHFYSHRRDGSARGNMASMISLK